MQIQKYIQHMPEVDDYRGALNGLSERWNLLTLLGQMSNIGIDMSETQGGFQKLTDRLLERLGHETLVKLTSEMEAKGQVAVDIVIRNLFERTADIGFLATDDDIRSFLRDISTFDSDDKGRKAKKHLNSKIIERFREYVAKYSVYNNIILLNPEGNVLVQLDSNNAVTYSKDPLIKEALTTNKDYVEVYRHSDLQPSQEKALIYAYRVTETNEPNSKVLGVLCLLFRFENEMDGIFRNLIGESDWMEITLLDKDGIVISSSDNYHIPIGAKLAKILDKDYQIVRFAGREYLAKTCETQGYEGFTGLGWYGHVMVPLDLAFRKAESVTDTIPNIDETTMQQLVAASSFFSDDLIDIPKQADRIQRELDVTVWNGNVQIANTKSGDNSFSKTLLNEISRTGARTKQVFEDSISNLNQTVISSFLDDAAFYALLAVDIMDRNLYERANDCRWWALTSRFKEILASEQITDTQCREMTDILVYINNLYTVYTNLFIYDETGKIQAVSNQDDSFLIGNKLSEDWVSKTLNLGNSQDYSVSSFDKTGLYNNKNTYVYGAVITHHESKKVLGGIGIVFDSLPQFKQMLLDSLPKNEKGDIAQGCFGIFADRNKTIVSSTNDEYPVDQTIPLDDRFFRLNNGDGCSEIVEIDQRYFVVGARMSSGYREYKVNDNYCNDIVALVFVEIGQKNQASGHQHRLVQEHNFRYPLIQGVEETIEMSTFIVNNRFYGVESKAIVCSIHSQEITPLLGSDERYLGVISFLHKTIPVVSLRSSLGGKNDYDIENDSIIITRIYDSQRNSEELVGLVVDRVQDSPEIPVRCLDNCEHILNASTNLVRYVVQPEVGEERCEMLSIINMEAVGRSILKDDKGKKGLDHLPAPKST